MTQVPTSSSRNAPPWPRWVAITLALSGLLLAACSPTLDWRQMRPDGWGLQLELPCRPATQTRLVPLAGPPVELTLMACTVEGQTFAVASADVLDPARVGPALRALGQAAQANVQGRVDEERPARVPGMTPNAESRQWRLQGRLPDGQAVVEHVLVFAHGPRVFQATLIGQRVDDRQALAFFNAIEVQR